jgi:hypothetical protein
MATYLNGRPYTESFGVTKDGTRYDVLINKTGAPSVKGSVVRASPTTDDAFQLAPAGAVDPIGVVLDIGVPDGAHCRVATSGKAQVLLQNGVAATRAYWIETSSTTAGRASMLAAPSATTHWDELGHCLENKVAGVDVLAWAMIHFN